MVSKVASVWFPNIFLTREENSEPFNQQLRPPARLAALASPPRVRCAPVDFTVLDVSNKRPYSVEPVSVASNT